MADRVLQDENSLKNINEGIAAGFGDKTEEQKAASALAKTGARAQLAPENDESFAGFVADGFLELGKGASAALGFGPKKEDPSIQIPGGKVNPMNQDTSAANAASQGYKKATRGY